MRSQVFSLLVDNNPGVLSRIAGLFSRRGYSIDSITAGATTDTRFTRIDYYYKKTGTPLEALTRAMLRIRGSYAFGVMVQHSEIL